MDYREKRRDEVMEKILKYAYFSISEQTTEKGKEVSFLRERFKEKMNELKEIDIEEYSNRMRELIKISTHNGKFPQCENACSYYFCDGIIKSEIAKIINVSPSRVSSLVAKGTRLIRSRLYSHPFDNPLFMGINEYKEHEDTKIKNIILHKEKQRQELQKNLENPGEFLLENVPDTILSEEIISICKKAKLSTLKDFLMSTDKTFEEISHVGPVKIQNIAIVRDKLVDKLNFKISEKTGFLIYTPCTIEIEVMIRMVQKLKENYPKLDISECEIINIQRETNLPTKQILINTLHEFGFKSIHYINITDIRIPDNIFMYFKRNYGKIIFGFDKEYHQSYIPIIYSWFLQLSSCMPMNEICEKFSVSYH